MLRRLKNLWKWSEITPPQKFIAASRTLYADDLSRMSEHGIIIDTRNPVETLDLT